MTTVGERITALELLSKENRRRIEELHDDIHSGVSVAWEQCVRGRLHAMQSALESADKLADATRALAEQRNQERRSKLTRMQWLYLAACATATAVSPYVVILLH